MVLGMIGEDGFSRDGRAWLATEHISRPLGDVYWLGNMVSVCLVLNTVGPSPSPESISADSLIRCLKLQN